MDNALLVVLVRHAWEANLARILFPDFEIVKPGDMMMGKRIQLLIRAYPGPPEDPKEADWERISLYPRLAEHAVVASISLSDVTVATRVPDVRF